MNSDDFTTQRPEREVADIVSMMAQDQVWTLLYERYKELEEKSGLTQAELARRIGLDRQSVHRWLSGPTNISVQNAAKLLAGMQAELEMTCRPWSELGKDNYFVCFDAGIVDVTTKPTATLRIESKPSFSGSAIGKYVIVEAKR